MKNITNTPQNQVFYYYEPQRPFDEVAEELHKIMELRKLYAEEEERLKKIMQTYVVDGKSCIGRYFVYSSYERKGAVDYSVIPELEHIDLERYRKEDVVCWKLLKL